MTCYLLNHELANTIGSDIGTSVLKMKKYHNKFWVELNNKTDHKNFQRIQLFVILTMGFIIEYLWYTVFTLIFGSLTPMRFPFGFVKNCVYCFLGYVMGFEIGHNYMRYIAKLTSNKLTTNKLIQEIKKPIKKKEFD